MIDERYRLLGQKMAAFQESKKLSIACLGGSLSRGEGVPGEDCFVSVFGREIQRRWKERGRIRVIQRGESGTMSSNGLFKAGELCEQKPDIVFIDYAMNDTSDRYLWECTEGLVYQFLKNEIAVVILLFCNEQGQCTRGAMEKTAAHYRVPVLDIGSTVWRQVQSGKMSWEEYAGDYVHPTVNGHHRIAEMLCDFMDGLEAGAEPVVSLPDEPVYSGAFLNYQILSLRRDMRHRKPGDVIFRKTITCRMLLMEFIQDKIKNPANVRIEINGRLVNLAEAYASMAWGNRVCRYLCGDGSLSEYDVAVILGRDRHPDGWDYSDMDFKLLWGGAGL